MTKQKFIPKSVPKNTQFPGCSGSFSVNSKQKNIFDFRFFASKPSYLNEIKIFQRKSRENYVFYCAWLTLKLPSSRETRLLVFCNYDRASTIEELLK